MSDKDKPREKKESYTPIIVGIIGGAVGVTAAILIGKRMSFVNSCWLTPTQLQSLIDDPKTGVYFEKAKVMIGNLDGKTV